MPSWAELRRDEVEATAQGTEPDQSVRRVAGSTRSPAVELAMPPSLVSCAVGLGRRGLKQRRSVAERASRAQSGQSDAKGACKGDDDARKQTA